ATGGVSRQPVRATPATCTRRLLRPGAVVGGVGEGAGGVPDPAPAGAFGARSAREDALLLPAEGAPPGGGVLVEGPGEGGTEPVVEGAGPLPRLGMQGRAETDRDWGPPLGRPAPALGHRLEVAAEGDRHDGDVGLHRQPGPTSLE